MAEENEFKTKEQIILSGLCPEQHATEEKVCKMCYENLLKRYKALLEKNQPKSPWQTW